MKDYNSIETTLLYNAGFLNDLLLKEWDCDNKVDAFKQGLYIGSIYCCLDILDIYVPTDISPTELLKFITVQFKDCFVE